jgi:hypothetical protein
MIYADQLKDAARVARKAPHPTQVVLLEAGLRVDVLAGGRGLSRTVSFTDLEFCQVNPVVDAIRSLNREAGSLDSRAQALGVGLDQPRILI